VRHFFLDIDNRLGAGEARLQAGILLTQTRDLIDQWLAQGGFPAAAEGV
jgi:hypothetical protein